jgi:hypothetical protein
LIYLKSLPTAAPKVPAAGAFPSRREGKAPQVPEGTFGAASRQVILDGKKLRRIYDIHPP